jgi:hypothetical protein
MSRSTGFSPAILIRWGSLAVFVIGLGLLLYAMGAIHFWTYESEVKGPIDSLSRSRREPSLSPQQAMLLSVHGLMLGGSLLMTLGIGFWASHRRVSVTPPSTVVVKVRCQTCRGLSDEAAKFCSGCGHAL